MEWLSVDASLPLIILKCSSLGDVKNYLDQIKIDVGNMSLRLDDLVAQQRETKQQGAYCANLLTIGIRARVGF